MLAGMQFADLKKNFSARDRERLITNKCVSSNESSVWLIDYWCGKKKLLRVMDTMHSKKKF